MKIEIQNVEKIYNTVTVLSATSFVIDKKGIHLLAGPNGSGKTTLLEMIAQSLHPTSGRINVEGKVATLFQENSLRQNAKLSEEIKMYQQIFSTPSGYINEIIDFLKLADHLDKKTTELSIGTQRRALILLMLLNHEADILILDEPCSGLDVESRKIIWWALNKFKKDKIILVSDHYLNESSKMAKDVIFLYNGNLLFHQDINEYLSQFEYQFVTPMYDNLEKEVPESFIAKNSFGEYIFSNEKINNDSKKIRMEDIYIYITNSSLEGRS